MAIKKFKINPKNIFYAVNPFYIKYAVNIFFAFQKPKASMVLFRILRKPFNKWRKVFLKISSFL